MNPESRLFEEEAESAELELTVESVIYQNEENGFRVIRGTRPNGSDGRVTAVGRMPEVFEGQDLVLEGEWGNHPKYGRQFQVEKCRVDQPTTEKGVKKYLASGLIKGIGDKYAERIVDRYGEDTLEVIEENPEHLLEIDGIGEKKLEKIEESWEKQRKIKDVMVSLKSHDISTAYGLKIYKEYGAQASTVVETDPYRLTAEIDGIGFKIADRIAAKVGIDPEDPQRIKAGLRYTLDQATGQGHVFLPRDELLEKAGEMLDVNPELVEKELGALTSDGELVKEKDRYSGKERVYLPSLYIVENELAGKLVELSRVGEGVGLDDGDRINELIDGYQIRSGIDYNEEQREAVRKALANKVTVITGGPGTGKTTIVEGILELMEELGWEVILTAPTGRAAKRLEETTGHEAKTIHRTLGFKPPNQFEHDAENQLSADGIVVDELSMVDTWLLHHLVQATPEGTHLVLVGDADQLPSVGPGDVMKGLIDSGTLGVQKLEKIYRQSRQSDIVTNAHRINQGEYPVIKESDTDFFLHEVEKPGRAADEIIRLVSERIPKKFDLNPMEGVQVLSPMYKGECGVDRLNNDLQDELNSGEEVFSPDGEFRIGDKVMQTENDYEKGVFNGDIGRVEGADRAAGELEVLYPDYGVITYEKPELDSLELAYAITIHKSQGSEYDAVVLPMISQHYIMLKRNLLYTAITRSRRLVVIVGSRKAIGMAINNDQESRRYTTLSRRLREKVDEKEGA
ncbi:MAG: ATP-dependent RecD-like DNA helicase [Candidatus Acetothermia bacterium]